MTSSAGDLRIAYFITSYGSGEQLFRLVQTLRTAEPDSPIVIHHDSFQQRLSPGLFDSTPHVHFVHSEEPIVWGDMTLESARWRAFKWILDHLEVDWVMLLSEQDYPIAPLRVLRQRLTASRADAFIRGQRIDEIEDPDVRHECDIRYMYRYYSVPDLGIGDWLPASWQSQLGHLRGLFISAVMRHQRRVAIYTTPAVLGLPTRIGIRQRRSPFSSDFPCWYNDCWFALSKKAMQHVVDYVDRHPEFVRYYIRTVIPLESATATILFNDKNILVENTPLHAIRWSDPQSGRPDVFSSRDLEYLRSSDALFARKFGAHDTDVLDQLDSVITDSSEEKV